MNANRSVLLIFGGLASLAGCATNAVVPTTSWSHPAIRAVPPLSSSGPPDVQASTQDDRLAPDHTVMPIGVGFTTGPYSTMVGATLDFPLDTQLTFGPSLQVGFDDDIDLIAVGGQVKYFPSINGTDSTKSVFLPYLTGGAGIASIDKKGRSRDTGLLLNVGAGVRYLTGENYRIGSEARLNIMPDELAGEHTFLSFELLQVVITF